MRFLLVGAAAVVAGGSLPRAAGEEVSFDSFLQHFGKTYSGEEYTRRRAIFEERLGEVARLNARPGASWKAGLSPFLDVAPEEMGSYFGYNKHLRDGDGGPGQLGLQLASLAELGAEAADAETADVEVSLPSDVDWRSHTPAVISPIKWQGGCGSCWAFAAVSAMESNIALNTGVLLDLSPQQLNSCAPNPNHCGGTGGCEGATAQLAFNYTLQAGGLANVFQYPYFSGVTGSTGTCHDSRATKVASITGYESLPRNDADALLDAVAKKGPVVVSVDATNWSLYLQGIFDMCNKTNPNINHAVTLVGYGEEKGLKYWLVRNSWGSQWGEEGYIRLRRYGADESCGMDLSPEEGFGCEGGPAEIEVCGECGILSDSSYPTGGHIFSRRLDVLI